MTQSVTDRRMRCVGSPQHLPGRSSGESGAHCSPGFFFCRRTSSSALVSHAPLRQICRLDPSLKQAISACFLVVSALILTFASAPAYAGETCAKNTVAYLTELLDVSRQRLLIVEYSEARGLLDESQACLSRLDNVVPPPMLGRLFQDLGMARLQMGDERAAAEAFRRAAVMSPEVRWEPRLGNKAMGNFLTIKEDVLLSSRRVVQLPALMPGARAALDGIPLDKSLKREVYPGTHLLQVQEDERGPWLGALIDVPTEGTIPPLPPVLVGRIFRSNAVLVMNSQLQLETQLAPGPGTFVKRATLAGAVGSLVLGGAALAISFTSRAAVLAREYETFDEGEALRTRSNLTLGVGAGLGGLGLVLSGASLTMRFGYATPAAERESR